MILFRPVGLTEMRLIWESRLRKFPPRLPEQPIFYPVLNFEYASQIANRWNTKSRDLVGYVTKFEVSDDYANHFEPHIVGGRIHEELWIPAERLEEFNEQIVPPITVIAAYFGDQFRGYVPPKFGLQGKSAVDQFTTLNATMDDYGMDFYCEIQANNTAVFLNFLFWLQHDFAEHGISQARRDQLLTAIERIWEMNFAGLPLPGLSG